MNLDTAIRKRRMVRRYAETAVPRQLVAELLDLGLRAPSAGFSQGVQLQALTGGEVDRFWQLTVDTDTGWLERLRTAGVLVLVWTSKQTYLDRYALPDKGWTDRDESRWSAPYWYVDAGMAAENILLGAVDRGLGACFFGIPPDKVTAVRGGLGVPEDQLSVGVISLGWPADRERSSGSPRRRDRLPQEQLLHWGAW